MKISAKGRYGLKAMVEIARATQAGDRLNLKTIAERQGIPEAFLEQLVIPLKRAGYLNSVRGVKGGYELGLPPADITAGDVLRALEGSLAPADCVDGDGEIPCEAGDCGKCGAKSVFRKMLAGLNTVVDSISLEDLLNEGELYE